MRGLRLVLAAQLAFFAVWGGVLLTAHRDAATVWLETDPVDPRDLLSGHFVALRYPIAAADAAGCAALRRDMRGRAIFVRLAPMGRTVTTAEGPAEILSAVECRLEPPASPHGEIWIAGALPPSSGDDRIVFGIERFYVPETSPLRSARSGSVVARVAINDAFHPRVVDLAPIEPPASPPS